MVLVVMARMVMVLTEMVLGTEMVRVVMMKMLMV